MNRKQHRNEHWKTWKKAQEALPKKYVLPARTFLDYYNSAFPVPEANKTKDDE